MKKLCVFAMVAMMLTIFNGCQKDDLSVSQLADKQLQEAVKQDVYVENGYLVFKSMNIVDSVIMVLNKMTNEEKDLWERQMGFQSARSEFLKLYQEYDKLTSYNEFLAYKKRNIGKLKFNDSDPTDCSIDYPFSTGYFLPILNNNGIYKVGKSISKYTIDNHYVILDGDISKLSNIENFQEDEMVISLPRLKSEITGLYSFPEDNPNGTVDPWHRKPNISDRKLKNEIYIDRYTDWVAENVWVSGYHIYLNQHGQKKSWGAWRDYATTYGVMELKCQVGSSPTFQDVRVHISAEVKPSINFFFYHYQITATYNPGYLAIPSINFGSKVTFRGFGFDYNNDFYVIDNPENYGTATTNNYPNSGWGY